MQTAECWMQNNGVPGAQNLKYFAYCILHFPGAGEGIKNTHPLKNQGWDTKKYSTVPPWLLPEEPLIDALTGAPVQPFPADGSEVVSFPAGVQKPCTKRLPLWESFREHMSSSQLLSKEALMKSARADGERFWVRRRFEKRRNTLCISRFSNCTAGAKDPLIRRRQFIQSFLKEKIP